MGNSKKKPSVFGNNVICEESGEIWVHNQVGSNKGGGGREILSLCLIA